MFYLSNPIVHNIVDFVLLVLFYCSVDINCTFFIFEWDLLKMKIDENL